MKKWTPYISLDCEGQIWNILPGYNHRILLEVRTQSSAIHFYDVDLSTGKTLKLTHDDVPWWSQAVFYAPPYLLIQEFSEEQNPDHVRLHFYISGALEWTKEQIRFDGFTGNALKLKNNSGEITHLSLEPCTDRTMFEFPWHYAEGEDYFSEVSEYLVDQEGIQPVRAIDYFENDQAIVIAYYQPNEKMLKLSLIALNEAGDRVLKVDLENNLTGIADPTFLISKRNVIFVKEKRHFFVYRIADF